MIMEAGTEPPSSDAFGCMHTLATHPGTDLDIAFQEKTAAAWTQDWLDRAFAREETFRVPLLLRVARLLESEVREQWCLSGVYRLCAVRSRHARHVRDDPPASPQPTPTPTLSMHSQPGDGSGAQIDVLGLPRLCEGLSIHRERRWSQHPHCRKWHWCSQRHMRAAANVH